MKIAYIIPSLVANGPCIVARDLVEVMTAHGCQCDVYYFDRKGTLGFPCPIHQIKMGDRMDFSSYDIVHSHEFRPNLYVLLHKQKGPKYICTLHNYVFRDYKSTYGRLKGAVGALLFLLSVQRHDRCVALSKDMMAYYERFITKDKLAYAYNTRIIKDEADSFQLPITKKILSFKGKDGILMGTNCRVLRRKNLNLVFLAMTKLPTEYRFVVVGDGPDMQLVKEQAHAAGVENRVLFAGRCEGAYRLLPLYDIFVIPSESEGFPLALLEAAYYGKKCVCSGLKIFQECFTNQEIKIFHLPDVDELARKIQEAYADDKLGLNIRKKFEDVYAPERFYEHYTNIYKL